MITKLDFCHYRQWFSAVVYYIEMMGYIAQGNLNIRIHRDIEGKMYRLDVMMGIAKFNNKHYEGYMSKIGGTKAKPV